MPNAKSENKTDNPTRAELKSSLEDAEFPGASDMAESQFGTPPKEASEEEE